MAFQMTRLTRTSTGAYAARKAIPEGVRKAYAARYGNAWEEKFHLNAGVSAHEARARFGEWLAEIEIRIASLKAAKASHPS